MTSRSADTAEAYREYLKTSGEECPFCNLRTNPTNQVIKTFDSFMLLQNRFPYTQWDGRKVEKHLMIVPKRHIEMLDSLDNNDSHEFLSLVSEYERQGFSVYLRANSDPTRSVKHQHTHLIKLT